LEIRCLRGFRLLGTARTGAVFAERLNRFETQYFLGGTVGTPKQLVDSYLGPKAYDEWQKMDQQERDAEHECWQNRARLQLSLSSPLVQRINPNTIGSRRYAP
jgi:hypothetical protein